MFTADAAGAALIPVAAASVPAATAAAGAAEATMLHCNVPHMSLVMLCVLAANCPAYPANEYPLQLRCFV